MLTARHTEEVTASQDGAMSYNLLIAVMQWTALLLMKRGRMTHAVYNILFELAIDVEFILRNTYKHVLYLNDTNLIKSVQYFVTLFLPVKIKFYSST